MPKGIIRPRVNLTKIRELMIPFSLLLEQKRIVSKIELIFSKIDAIEKQVDDSLTEIDQLKKNVLKKPLKANLCYKIQIMNQPQFS